MIRNAGLFWALLIAVGFITHETATFASASPYKANAVVQYLDGAELQAETDAQRREIARALQDMLKKPAAQLRAQRYAGDSGKPGELSITDLLRAHFVPTRPASLDANQFYREVRQPEARAAIRKQLESVKRALSTGQ